MNARPPAADSGGRDPGTHVAEIGQAVHVGLMGLQHRIDELQRSVETLAVEGRWLEPGPDLTYAPPASTPFAYPDPISTAPYGAPWEQPFEPPYETQYDGTWAQPFEPPQEVQQAQGWVPPPRPEPAYPSPADLLPPPPPAPAEWEQPFEPPFAPSAAWAHPAPAPTSPSAQPEAPAPWLTVTLLDAGPFADLIELRHFEEALAALPSVHDVRVRRFGHGRARIEIGMSAMQSLGAELERTGQSMEIKDGPDGELVVELPPAPDPEPDDPTAPSGSSALGEPA